MSHPRKPPRSPSSTRSGERIPDHQVAAMEPDPVAAAGASSSPPPPSDHQIAAMESDPAAAGASSSPPPSDHRIAAMESDPVAAGASSSSPPPSPAPATSPPSSPAPAASPPRQTRDDDERGAVECADPGGDLNPAPPLLPQQDTVEDATVGSDVEQEEEAKKEAMAGAGEALRSFMEVRAPLDANSWPWRFGIL
ncbi:classical arabinogalactan protein 9-like isoform X2 [Miscanthus floridulus]|uniref:classical arabinogalactan protein 9-like isoform X2 n=1 Tax=Miscanthus floridulus TaxID=154761 RepID=UPI0034594365